MPADAGRRLSVEALGGRLEVRAAFPEQTVGLEVGKGGNVRRRRKQAGAS